MKIVNLSWGVGSLGTITMINSVAALYVFFLVSIVGMDPALAGLLVFVSKAVDVVSDPLMGWISDHTNSRWGRRRPYLLGSSLLCGLAMGLLFSASAVPAGMVIPYVLLCLLLHTLAVTAFNVPYLAMPAEMTDDYHERSRIMSYRAFFLVSGSFMGTAGSGYLLTELGRDAAAYSTVGWVLGGVVFLAMLACFLGTSPARFTERSKTSLPAINQFKLILVNKPFLSLGAVKAMQFLQLAASTTATLFFFTAIYGQAEELLFPLGAMIAFGSILGIPMWLAILKRIGKREMFMAALVVNCLVTLTWLLASADEPMTVFLIRAFFLGFTSGGIVMCSQSMITDVIAYDRRLSGINREGVFSAAFSFIEKSTYAIGPLLVGTLLSWFGYDASIPRGQPQPDGAMFAVTLGQIWIPVACIVAQFLLLLSYRLDEEMLNSATVHALGAQEAEISSAVAPGVPRQS